MRRPDRRSIAAALRAGLGRLPFRRFDRSVYAVSAGIICLLAASLLAPTRPALDLPADSDLPTYTQAWTLVDMIRHTEAGEVLTLSTEKGAIIESTETTPVTPAFTLAEILFWPTSKLRFCSTPAVMTLALTLAAMPSFLN